MRTLAWNCQGLGKPKAGRTLKALLQAARPDLVFLSEIKTQKINQISTLLTSAHLPNHQFVPPLNFAGGLCLAWSNNITITIISCDRTHISALVSTDPHQPTWTFTGVYCVNQFPLDLEGLFPRVLDDQDNEPLCKIPSPKEIKQVMFSFASNKSPGPDGLPALFYKNFWSITGNALIFAVQHFFRTGFLLKALNHTLVTLIPKQNHPNQVENFRPISLCNVAYKVISKVLANRLKPLLQKFISPNQTAFVEGRNINENSLISQEIMHYLHKRKGKKGYLAIKVDLSKAYDRVEWELLKVILHNLGVCHRFINLIAQCISTCSFSFLINGSPFGFLKPSRGIRQGDPISPYLFIIYTELLSRLLLKEEASNNFRGVKIARACPVISHLLYADDLVVYCRDTMEDVSTIMKTMDKFSTWSGQCINHAKSFVHYSKNVPVSFKQAVVSWFNLEECNHCTKHLGLPFCKPKSRVRAFTDVVTKFQQKLSGWKSKNLSQAGRAVLIKAVAQAIPAYIMSTFLLPVSICDLLDKTIRKFWWGENEKGNSLYLRCWNSLCLPKACGGLGFRKSIDFNRSLIAKLGWQCANKENRLWIQLLEAKYLRGTSFLESGPPPKDASWVWQDIAKCKDLVKPNVCFTISVNSTVKTWSHQWIPSLPDFVPTPNPLTTLQPFNFNNVGDLISPVCGDWDVNTLIELFPLNVVNEIRKIFISPPQTPQQLIWIPSKSGKFSTKSCYIQSQKRRFPQLNSVDTKLFKNLWNAKIHNRHKVLLWKIIFDLLPTRRRLSYILQVGILDCPICGAEVEDLNHLFLHCPLTKALWFNSKWSFKLDCLAVSSVREWIIILLDKNDHSFISNENREFFLIYVVLTFEIIWLNRNKVTHNAPSFDVQEMTQRVEKNAKEHFQAQMSSHISKCLNYSSKGWRPPKEGWITVNTDASFKAEENEASMAIIIRNHNGSILFAETLSRPCLNALAAEAFAIKEACVRLHFVKAKFVTFESDCLVAIETILNKERDMDWAIREPIDVIRRFWTSWPKWNFKFIPRASNCAAHNLAAWAFLSNVWDKLSLDSIPFCCFCDGGFPFVDVVPNLSFYY
ncbi:hypothetical protein ACJIZ3_002247 [Penstemon smallii]|uniref:Reverse transcriptase domain-containing protein n=1 Tax=Penstemon smallii TaxID=265156 RepID=A0ABD3U5V5_9LAMI